LGVTETRTAQAECRRLERYVLHALAASNRRAARPRSSPVSHARGGYASRPPRPRWTAGRFPVRSTWDGPVMTKRDEPVAQLATRIPKELHRRGKLHCGQPEIAGHDLVADAIADE